MRQPRGGEAVAGIVAEVGKGPAGLLEAERGQGGQGLGLAQRLQPIAHVGAGGALPAFQQPEDVKTPQCGNLDGKEVDGAADVDKGHEASQAAHLAAGAELARAEPRLNIEQGLGSSRMVGEALEEGGVRLEDALLRGDAVDLFADAAAGAL